MQRRTVLSTTCTGLALAVAGCSSGSDSANDTEDSEDTEDTENGDGSDSTESVDIDTSGPVAVVESYYQAVETLEPESTDDEILDAIRPAFHSASLITTRIRRADDDEQTVPSGDLTTLSVSVTERNLSVDALEEDWGLREPLDFEEDTIEAIAAENAVVTGTVEFETTDNGSVTHLTATQNGTWQIVL
jgi:hypothetical protein